MLMETCFFDTDFPVEDLGSNNFTTFGFTTVEAIKKNSIKKNMMSLIEEVFTSAPILRFFRRFMDDKNKSSL